MANVPQREPEEFSAGDTLAFTRSLPDYPAPDWSIAYELTGNGVPRIEFVSQASNAAHAVTVDAATTAQWLPGQYNLSGYVTNGTERHQVYFGQFILHPNQQATGGNEDARTHAQKMIAMLEGLLLQGGGLLESRVGDTMFKYQSLEEVRTEHGYWVGVRRSEVAKQRAKQGRPTGNKIRTRMNIAGAGRVFGGGVWPYW